MKQRPTIINGREVAIADPAATLHPTALRILRAAKHLLVTKGLAALSLEAIAAEAGVNKAATRYYFGSKSGLIQAVVDEIVLDGCAAVASDVAPHMTDAERVRSFVDNIHRMATDGESYAGYFDILPHAVRDKQLRTRLVYLYELWYDWNVEWLGLTGLLPPALEADLRGLGQFTAAVADGMAVQAEIHGKDYDPDPTLRLLRLFLADIRGRLIEAARGEVARG
jgi:AcrR family transcriptional regulator